MPELHPLTESSDDFMGSIQFEFYDRILDPRWVREQLEQIARDQDLVVPEGELDELSWFLYEQLENGLMSDENGDGCDPEICQDCHEFGELEEKVVSMGAYGDG